MTALKSQPKLSIMYREHKELLEKLAPGEKTRIICCGAKLINQFGRWQNWKKAHYPSDWIYQTLDGIRHELLDEHSKHVIRAAIALLHELKFLSVRQNSRCENGRNGQDRTHQYKLHTDRIEEALENLYQPQQVVEEAGNADESSSFNVEFSTFTPELSKFTPELSKDTVERYTQIPYTDNSTNPFTLSKRESEEKIECDYKDKDPEVNQGEEDYWEHNDNQDKLEKKECDNNKAFPEDESSGAALALNYVELTQSNATSLQRKVSYFESSDEEHGFYRALIELGRSKSGVATPVGWANSIIQSIKSGNPCIYLDEFREGIPVGACERREWEIAPGKPYSPFVQFLARELADNGFTPGQASVEALRKLRDPNVATTLWEGYKRMAIRLGIDWRNQQARGVRNAYIPPEMMPMPDIPVEQVVQSLQSLQSGCLQLSPTSTTEQISLSAAQEPCTLALEPGAEAEEVLSEPEPEPEPVTLTELQRKLNSRRYSSIVKIMIRSNPGWGWKLDEELDLVLPIEEAPPVEHLRSLLDNGQTRNRVLALLDKHPEWGYSLDSDDQLVDW